MKIRKFKDKSGRVWHYGKATAEELEQLNVEKDFDAALDVLHSIRKTHNYLFNRTESFVMDRSVYGKRADKGRRL